MKAIVVTDQAAGAAGMTLTERPEPRLRGTTSELGFTRRGFARVS
jgi:hypothetical protein